MHKHPDLTLGRLKNTHRFLIEGRLVGATHPLKVEFCSEAHPDEQTARKKGPWQEVPSGFEYGPAFRVFWFRVTGQVPKEWAGTEVAMVADVGGERTVWRGNVPERGIDGKHAQYRIADEATGGEKIDLCIQVYTSDPGIRVHGVVPPRKELSERYEKAELVQVHTALTALHYDFLFGLSMLEALSKDDPSYATLLRGMNQACNLLEADADESIAPARKAIRDALNQMTGDLKHTVTPVGHAHLDTAWLWPLATTRMKMAHTTANQLYLMERYPEFVFAHSQASQYEWLEKEHPELLKRILYYAERGQWEPVGSMWVEADCNLTGGEALIRQFLYGRRYFQRVFGRTTDDMWLPDVFGYSAALPQILEKFGIHYFLTQKISWNQFNKFPHNTFWWQGIDGTRVWSHFPPADTYIGDCTPKQLVQSVRGHKDQARSDHSLYLFGWGDGGGGPTEQHLELIRRGTNAPCLPEIQMGRRAIDFFRDAKQKSRDLAVWVGELYLEFHRGTYTSQAATKKANRECEFLLRDAEWLSCFRDDFKTGYPAQALEESWKLVLLNQFHDIIPGSSITEVYEDAHRDYGIARKLATDAIQDALTRIGGKFDTREMSHPHAIFSSATLPSQVEVVWEGEEVPRGLKVGENLLPVQEVHEFGERKLIFETPDDALGAVAVADLVEQAGTPRVRLKARERRLENDQWSVRFDSQGHITSITNLDERMTEFILPGQLANVFQLFDDRPNFWDAWDVDLFTFETKKALMRSESFEVVERGPVRVAVELVKRFGKSTIRQRISLGPTPGIRFDTWIDWHEDHKMLKVAFPVNVNASRATYEIQLGHVERPTHMNTTWDLARFEVPAQKWVDISQGDYGMALLNDGKYGYDCQGNHLRMSLLRSPKAPDPNCDMGEHRFSYVLLPHFGPLVQSDVVAASYALNAKVRTAPLKPGPGVASSATPQLLGLDTDNVVIESVKRAEDSAAIIVRMYECHNCRGRAALSCALPIKRAFRVDLNEIPIEELELPDSVVEFDYAPFEIITFLLKV